jgi:hypothetical protein
MPVICILLNIDRKLFKLFGGTDNLNVLWNNSITLGLFDNSMTATFPKYSLLCFPLFI